MLRAQVIRGFQSAAAEMWMLGLTDYQVITTHSGYGRLGSFMSGKYHQVVISYASWLPHHKQACRCVMQCTPQKAGCKAVWTLSTQVGVPDMHQPCVDSTQLVFSCWCCCHC